MKFFINTKKLIKFDSASIVRSTILRSPSKSDSEDLKELLPAYPDIYFALNHPNITNNAIIIII